jgi:hypothetical protein
MFQTKVVEKIKTHILCPVTFLRKSRRFLDNGKKYGTVREPMRFACWLSKAAYTHSQYLIFIAVALQRWLLEHASILRYIYIVSAVEVICLPYTK